MLFIPYLIALVTALAIRNEPQPLKFPLKKQQSKEGLSSNRQFRSAPGTQEVHLWVDGFYYMIDIGLGEKDETISVTFDTGSADLWVEKRAGVGLKSWKNMSEPFSIWYYDHTLLHGWFGKSLVWLDNGLEVTDLQWALADKVSNNNAGIQGILGVGRVENEAVDEDKRYPNLVQRLKDLGHIKTNGYSYYLNAKEAQHGSVVIGGIDKAKIKGKVAKVPLITSGDNARFDDVLITKITGVNGEIIGENIEVGMDTGYTLSRLPSSVVKQVQNLIPGAYVDDWGYVFVPCNLDRNLSILVWFDDVEIKYTLDDLSIRSLDDYGEWHGECILGIQSTLEGNPNFFGVSSMKHAYVTVNHDENVAYISNVNYTDDEDIVLL